jgi:ABC-type uncharacterized transport system ATPase subunit
MAKPLPCVHITVGQMVRNSQFEKKQREFQKKPSFSLLLMKPPSSSFDGVSVSLFHYAPFQAAIALSEEKGGQKC